MIIPGGIEFPLFVDTPVGLQGQFVAVVVAVAVPVGPDVPEVTLIPGERIEGIDGQGRRFIAEVRLQAI